MITKIVAKLKTGSIKNVVPFGTKPAAIPYVVVKQEPARGNETRFRIIAHMVQGAQVALNDYIFHELSHLLTGFEADDSNTNHFKIEEPNEKEWSGVAAVSDDNTISMERSFYAPLLLF
jgi:hypothetical protein